MQIENGLNYFLRSLKIWPSTREMMRAAWLERASLWVTMTMVRFFSCWICQSSSSIFRPVC
ncbi:MAG: hypothetical protein ABII74_03575 [Elusimicrobiota bacterium]